MSSVLMLTSAVWMLTHPCADWARLTKTLTVNIFRSVTPFDEPFMPLEILRHALRDDVIFLSFEDFEFFPFLICRGHSEPPGTLLKLL
jgi:hypothetical protein